MIILLLFFVVLPSCMALIGNEDKAIPEQATLPYRVVEEKDISYGGCKRVGIKIVVPDDAVRADIDQTMDYVISSKKSAWKDITVWAYRFSEEELAPTMGQTMGMREYSKCR